MGDIMSIFFRKDNRKKVFIKTRSLNKDGCLLFSKKKYLLDLKRFLFPHQISRRRLILLYLTFEYRHVWIFIRFLKVGLFLSIFSIFRQCLFPFVVAFTSRIVPCIYSSYRATFFRSFKLSSCTL